MIKLEDINKEVKFHEREHKYFLGNQELTSVSVVIGLYKPQFDPFGHIKRACAKREGLTIPEIDEKWNKAKMDGLTRGKSFHRQAEHFVKTGEILNDDYKDVIEKFSTIKFSGKLFSEIALHHPNHLIAGTTDLVELFPDNTCNLFDFKSNKKIEKESKYGTKLLHPLDDLDECEISTYGIQLNLYKYMLEYHGYKVKKIVLFHINPETRNIDIYPIRNMQKEVKKMLNHYSF